MPVTATFFVPEETTDSYKISVKINNKLEEKVLFNPQDQDHIELINLARQRVEKDLRMLHIQDLRIVGSVVVGIAAMTASIIFPLFGALSILAFGYLGRLSAQREKMDIEYRKHLNNLIGCCEWVLAEVPKKAQDAVFKCKAVTDMIDALAPVTNKVQLEAMIDDSIEKHFIDQADKTEDKLAANNELSKKILGRPLNQKERNLYFSIYGYKQGKWSDILVGMYYLTAHGAGWVKKSVSSLWKNKDEPVAEGVAAAAAAAPTMKN